MIRTCRLFFPVRNTYNVSLLNQRTGQPKQISVEFSFYAEQKKGNYLQKRSCEKVEFSTFKQQGKIEQERNQQKKSKNGLPSDYVTFKTNKASQKASDPLLNEAAENMNIDFSTFKENLKSKASINKLDVEPLADGIITQRRNESITALKVDDNEYNIQPNLRVTNSYEIHSNKRISPTEAIKSLKIMVKTGNRAPPNLKFYSQVLMAKEDTYSLVESCNVLYSCAKLSFAHLPLLTFMSKHILEALSRQEEFIPKVLVSLLQSVCKLKYRNCELIDVLCKKLCTVQQSLSTEQTTLCLFALSNVNVQSVYVDHFINILSKLKNTDFNKTRNFLNYIWASVILKKENSLPLEHLEIVLSKNFTEQLTISGDNTLLNKIKLANISGIASGLKNYKGALLEHLILSPVLSRSKNDFLTSMRDSMSYIFPKTGFMEALSYAGSGVFIDIECCLDSSSNPVLLKSKAKNNKIGIVLLDHSDFCLENVEMTGVTSFKIERIKNQGYKVLTIPYTEFPFNSALSIKIAYLRNKFKKVLAKASNQ